MKRFPVILTVGGILIVAFWMALRVFVDKTADAGNERVSRAISPLRNGLRGPLDHLRRGRTDDRDYGSVSAEESAGSGAEENAVESVVLQNFEGDAAAPRAQDDSDLRDGEEKENDRLRHEERQTLEAQFLNQGRDLVWSRDTTMAIHNALVPAMKPPGSSVKAVECRETLCRIQVTTNDEEQYKEAFTRLMSASWLFGTEAFFLSRDDVEGHTRGLVMYVARKGTELPSIRSAGRAR